MRKGGDELECSASRRRGARALRVTGHSCGSTANTLQVMVEDAVYEAAPDMSSLMIEGFEERQVSGFVPLGIGR